MNVLFFQVTVGLYVGGALAYLSYLITSYPRLAWGGRLLLGGGFIVHCAALVLRYIEAGHIPVTSLHESLSFFAFLLVGSFLLLRLYYTAEIMGAFVAPLALLLVIWAAVLPKEIIPLPTLLKSWWLPIHITFAFAGEAVFALACCAGVIYLMQERLLKSKRAAGLSRRLPSLAVLDEINYRALTIGFPLLTIGIITGAAWSEHVWGAYWRWDPKQNWSLATWLLYAILLHQRLAINWRGKKAAVMAIIGFGSVLFTFLGVNLLLHGPHTYAEWLR
jgi:cytochrome c-type biogenesis protein CcsB